MFQRHFDDGLAQASFMIACERTRAAVIVDPRRDVEPYVAAARDRGLTITASIETHVHADFVSGSRELAAIGARVIGGPGSALRFDHHEASHGERLAVGDITLEFLHTPGHTPEHISILATSANEPARILTGDTLFVGAVGRPDLLGEELTRQLAGQLFDSLFGTLLKLPDDVEVHPGHGAGSLCGAGIGREPHSTIGQERRFNPMLRYTAREEFVAAVLADLPETPPYFARMKRVNQDGPPVLGLADGFAGIPPIAVADAARAVKAGAMLIDLRPGDAFCAGHPAGALNIGFGSKVGYWAGWVVPGDTPIVLLAGTERDAAEAGRQLLRVGLDRITGFISGGFEAWREAGLEVRTTPQINVDELRQMLARRDPLLVLDVRTKGEWNSGHLDAALNVPVGEVPRFHATSPGLPLATICEGGYRSLLAASVLSRAGFPDVVNVSGGMAAYRASAADLSATNQS